MTSFDPPSFIKKGFCKKKLPNANDVSFKRKWRPLAHLPLLNKNFCKKKSLNANDVSFKRNWGVLWPASLYEKEFFQKKTVHDIRSRHITQTEPFVHDVHDVHDIHAVSCCPIKSALGRCKEEEEEEEDGMGAH